MKGSESSVWDDCAPAYDAERAEDPVYAACTSRVVTDLRPYGRILDAGCGTGLQTRLLCGREIHALDYSAKSLEILRSRLPGVTTQLGDLREIPYPDAHFDCVLCANTLQHLTATGQRQAAGELMRVLKPGGRFAVSVHHYSKSKQRAHWIKEGKPGQAGVDYIFRFTREELAALFPGASIRAVGFYGWPLQAAITQVAGKSLALLAHGHMLIAFGTRAYH